MKKLLYMASFLALTFTSCDPMEDVYDEVDEANAEKLAEEIFLSDKTLIEDGYRLVDSDFELSTNDDVKSFKSFSKYQAAADFLPEILGNKMLFGDAGVEYKVGFDFYRGKSDALSNYRKEHEVSEDEYTAVGGVVADLGFFISEVKSGDKADAILKAEFVDAEEGDVKKFISKGDEYASIEAFTMDTLKKADFQVIVDAVKADDLKKHLVNEDDDLEFYYGANSKYGSFEGRTSKWAAYDEYKDMDEDDLEDLIEERQVEASIIALKAKYPTATINDSEGKKITYIITFDAYDGSTKTKSLRFECTAEGVDLAFSKLGSLSVKVKHEFYMFDGTDWEIEEDVYRLSSEDYDSMGEDYGFPGKFGNFDDNMSPDHYLPTFINNKWAYAQDNDVKLIVYKFYDSGVTELRVDEYTFNTEMKWTLTATTVDGSANVAFKDRVWVFVPPIKFVKSDKDATVSHTLTDENYEMVGDGTFDNFYIKGMTPEEVDADIVPKITKILKANFDLVIGDVYEVTYAYYDGENGTTTIKLEAVADN